MQLRQWISELNSAFTEHELVALMGAFVRQIRETTDLPPECLPGEPASATEIRVAAARLARQQLSHCEGGPTGEAYQKLLVLFGLAVDRIALLETRGLFQPAPRLRGGGAHPATAH